MKWICPGCGARLDESQVNVEASLAVCIRCGTTSAASDLRSVDELRSGTGLPQDSRIVVGLDESLTGRIELGRMAPRIKTWGLWGFVFIFLALWSLGFAAAFDDCPLAELLGVVLTLTCFAWVLVVPIFIMLERQALEVGPQSLVAHRHGVLSSRRDDYAWADIEAIALLSASHDWREGRRPAPEDMALYWELRACTYWGPIPRGYALANGWFFRSEPTKWLVLRHDGHPACVGEPCTNAEREWLLGALQSLAIAHGASALSSNSSGRPLVCPQCSERMAVSSVDVADGRARCEHCDSVFGASSLRAGAELQRAMTDRPADTRMKAAIDDDGHTITIHIPRWRLRWNAVTPLRHSPTFGRIVTSSLLTWFLLAFLLHRAMECPPSGALIYAAVPVLLVGILKLRSVLRPFLEDQRLVLNRADLQVERRRSWKQRSESVAYSEIDSIEVDNVPQRALTTGHRCRVDPRPMVSFQLAEHVHFQRAVAVKHGCYVTGFAQWTSPEEMAWLVDLVNAVVAIYRQQGSNVSAVKPHDSGDVALEEQ